MKRRLLLGAIFAFALASLSLAQGYTVIHSFSSEAGSPYSAVTQTPDGKLYGTTAGGGLWGQGSIFVLAPGKGGFSFSTLYSFTAGEDGASPRGALLLATDGNFYGTTYDGGPSAPGGTLFRIDTVGNLSVLHNFADAGDGYDPSASLIQGTDGYLYGVTESGGPNAYGTVFRADLEGNVSVLHSFSGGDQGAFPRGALVEGPDGNLYGTTFSGGAAGGFGTLFRISTAGDFTTLHVFTGPDGESPSAGMVIGPDGNLYGTTEYGGGIQSGTVFQADLSGNLISSLVLAPPGVGPVAPLIVGSDGNLYGTTPQTVYQFTTGGVLSTIHTFSGPDGSSLASPLIQAQDGLLYGTAVQGGLGLGTVFRLEMSGDSFETIHSFAGPGARNPIFALLQDSSGSIYGTAGGGLYGLGTVFRVDLTGGETVLHTFTGSEGSYPASLIRTADGTLFGSAMGGGSESQGTIFKIDSGGAFGLVHPFVGDEGAQPFGLTLAPDGTLFGATYDPATVFHLDLLGGFSSLHTLSNPEGDEIDGQFVAMDDGTFVGTGYSGGTNGLGSVFKFDAAGSLSVLHSFSGWDGMHPSGPLVKGPDGKLYGMTAQGGASGFGTIYRIDSAGRVTSIHAFSGVDGLAPTNGLIVADDGNLYGTTRVGGALQFGTVFRSDLSGNVTVLHAFAGSDGKQPFSQVFQAIDGGLYGATQLGGLFGSGVVFRVDLPPALSISGVTPSSGPATGGTDVTLSGFNFKISPTVLIGGVVATGVVAHPTFSISAVTPALSPGTLNDVSVTNYDSVSGALASAFFADFLDVPGADPFHPAVESVLRNGVTAGCGGGNYCRDAAVSRAQMAVFVLKGEHGQGYAPPACIGVFADVTCPSQYADWIEELFTEGITGGCGGANYCPQASVQRQQSAVFLLKAEHGSSYAPPDCTGIFADVPCPSPFADWVERLYTEGVTGGCGTNPTTFCPAASVTRGQMAVFIVRTFQLQ